VPSLIRGRIVYPRIAIADPQGRNPKEGRPFVVISSDAEIQNADTIHAVGITSELQSSPEDQFVLLPYGPNAKSGIKQKSAALCTWLIEISVVKLDVARGYVHPNLVDEIVKKIIVLKSIPQVASDDPVP
jgi:mRNA-degrading endonuclease toxin of MazEF toxin-antitoxin module